MVDWEMKAQEVEHGVEPVIGMNSNGSVKLHGGANETPQSTTPRSSMPHDQGKTARASAENDRTIEPYLNGETIPSNQGHIPTIDWESRVSELEGGKPKRIYLDHPDQAQTGAISTITGKPITKVIGHPTYEPASFKTLMEAGFVDDNDAKIKLFAEARGIDPKKYEVKDGKIWFQGSDGRMYPEIPREADVLLKKLAAELPAESLADIGAAVGAFVGGIPGAIAGSAGGEGLRKQIGKYFFGDNQDALDYAQDMGVQALFGAVDAGVASKLMKHLNTRKIKRATGNRITSELTGEIADISDAQRAAGRAISTKGKQIGVDLLPHQAMDDPTLTGYYKLLRDNPKTARQVRRADDLLDEQVENAAQDLVLDISPNETDPYEVGVRLSSAADTIIARMKKDRRHNKVFWSDVSGSSFKSPDELYKTAYASGVAVDTQPVIDEITRLKGSTKPGMKAHTALTRIERMLFKEDSKKALVPETSIEVLDNVKQEIDAILYGKNAKALSPKLKRKLHSVKDQLTTQTDAVSPDYQKARKIFELASPNITKTENGIIGALSGMKNDEVKERAVKKIFNSPFSIQSAKKRIEGYDPELWADVVAEYFRDNFERAAKIAQGSGGKVLNRPGKYSSRMWDRSIRRKMKAATEGMVDANGDSLYGRISDFFQVMEKASIGQGKESATQPRQKMAKNLEGVAGRVSRRMYDMKAAAVDMFLEKSSDVAFDRNAQRLLDLMQTQEGVELIAKAKGYGPTTEKGIKAFTTLLLMSCGTNAEKLKGVYDARKQSGQPGSGNRTEDG